MLCPKCGYIFNEGVFCPECGTKYDANEAERIEEQRREEERKKKAEEEKKRELEIEKAKVEQERLAAERAEHEAELIRQQNEKARIEQNNRIRMEEQEKKQQEELLRTFNGVLYNTTDEMNAAKIMYEEKIAVEKRIKRANVFAVWGFILSIATYPLLLTGILWFVSLVVSFVFCIMAINTKKCKKKFAIAGLIINVLFVLTIILAVIYLIKNL